MKTTNRKLMTCIAIAAILSLMHGAEATLLLHETFDYTNDSGLATQTDVAAAGAWFGNSFERAPNSFRVVNGDTGGDNGTASLAVTGIQGTGGRLALSGVTGGDAFVFYPTPVTGEGNSVYVSFLFKPDITGRSYVLTNATHRNSSSGLYPNYPVDPASAQHQLGRFDITELWGAGGTAGDPNNAPTNLSIRWRNSATRPATTNSLPPGTTVFVVMKTTMVAGAQNDTVDLFINPALDGAEPAPTVSTSSTAESSDMDIVPSLGILGCYMRSSGSSTGTYEIDELRAGTTWEDVTSSLTPAPGELLLHETFDYTNDSQLATQTDVAAPGSWFGNSFGDVPNSFNVLNGDTGGDNGTASLAMPGLQGTGGRLYAQEASGDAYVFFPTPVTGEGSSVYASFLFKPGATGRSFIMGNATHRSSSSGTYPSYPVDPAGVTQILGRFDITEAMTPDANLSIRWRNTVTRPTTTNVLPIGTTVFVVIKTTLVAGLDNDTIELFINPALDGSEPAPTVSTSSTAETGDMDILPSLGFLGWYLRGASGTSTGHWEMDELRVGTSWAVVTSSLGGAPGDGDGDGGDGSDGTPVAGMPVTGAIGLGLVAAACALGGSMFLRKK